MKHLGTKQIETPRLLLRPFRPEDADAMFRNWASDPDVTKYLTWPCHDHVDVSRWVLSDWCSHYGEKTYYQWAIVPQALGEPIGSITVVGRNDPARWVEIGYCIGKAWWHQGIMTEALSAVIRFFFEQVGVGRVQARHDACNPYSGAVMRKCGMRCEGTMAKAGRSNQGICDMVWYGIVKEEYEAQKAGSEVVFLTDAERKNHAAARILHQLPAWFGIPQATQEYVKESTQLPMWAVYGDGEDAPLPVGFAALKQTGDKTAEIFVMGVEPGYHRRGLGRKLMAALESWAAKQGYLYLQVKTVQMGRYEEYDRTNRFYRAVGFRELECFPTLWDPHNPCQIYIKYIGGRGHADQ